MKILKKKNIYTLFNRKLKFILELNKVCFLMKYKLADFKLFNKILFECYNTRLTFVDSCL